MKTCKTCGHPTATDKDLYCPTHGYQKLVEIEQSGYFQPLTVRTVDGVQKLSKRRFLEYPTTPLT